jgi:hypothetical protein
VWHDQPGLFAGPALELGRGVLTLLVPLLALPQATHYVLDGWIWRRSRHAELREVFGGRAPDAGASAAEPRGS